MKTISSCTNTSLTRCHAQTLSSRWSFSSASSSETKPKTKRPLLRCNRTTLTDTTKQNKLLTDQVAGLKAVLTDQDAKLIGVNRALRERTEELEKAKEAIERMKRYNVDVTDNYAAALRLNNGLVEERRGIVRELEGLRAENKELKDELEIF
jgi:chromosome segregation ATPase